MTLKLFKVNAEAEYFVIAENESDAQADEYLHEHINTSSADTTAQEIESLSDVPEDWMNSIPYGDANLTVKQFMLPKLKEEQKELEKRLQKIKNMIESCKDQS